MRPFWFGCTAFAVSHFEGFCLCLSLSKIYLPPYTLLATTGPISLPLKSEKFHPPKKVPLLHGRYIKFCSPYFSPFSTFYPKRDCFNYFPRRWKYQSRSHWQTTISFVFKILLANVITLLTKFTQKVCYNRSFNLQSF